jgi:hypothetical protein
MTLHRISLLPLGLFTALAGCMNDMSTVSSAPVRVVAAGEVAQCKYITNVSDRPGMYGALATQGQEYARKAILDQAAQSGANTVVFDKVEPGTMVTEITATAYRC